MPNENSLWLPALCPSMPVWSASHSITADAEATAGMLGWGKLVSCLTPAYHTHRFATLW